MKKLFLVIIISFLYKNASAQSNHILWYNQPAEFFEESLVLGNGKMGATVFGGVESDKIYLNDITLWSGEPVNANMNMYAYKNLTTIREALKNEDYKLARAAEITCDLIQMRLMNQYPQLYLHPHELYEKIKEQGLDWNRSLETRGRWTYDNYDETLLPFLSTFDLLEIAHGLKKPFWY